MLSRHYTPTLQISQNLLVYLSHKHGYFYQSSFESQSSRLNVSHHRKPRHDMLKTIPNPTHSHHFNQVEESLLYYKVFNSRVGGFGWGAQIIDEDDLVFYLGGGQYGWLFCALWRWMVHSDGNKMIHAFVGKGHLVDCLQCDKFRDYFVHFINGHIKLMEVRQLCWNFGQQQAIQWWKIGNSRHLDDEDWSGWRIRQSSRVEIWLRNQTRWIWFDVLP
jgi:hypothetical protein